MKNVFLFIVFVPCIVLAQTVSENYIKSITYKVATSNSISNPSNIQANQSIKYFDGLGRTIQNIDVKQSASDLNVISIYKYDAFGRQSKKYLSYSTLYSNQASGFDFETNAESNIINYPPYSGQTPFGEYIYENSPLNRVKSIAAQGNDWALINNHTQKIDYHLNSSIDNVKIYEAYSNWNISNLVYDVSLTKIGNSFYNPNVLYKNIIKNENWTISDGKNNTTEKYIDKDGHLVLERKYSDYIDQNGVVSYQVPHDTYYVFDQFSNLVYVIPPLVTNVLLQLDGLCYQYKYDLKNRNVEKKLPSKDWEFFIYDKLDRIAATGPSLSPFEDIIAPNNLGWIITKYDAFNRIVYTGWKQDNPFNSSSRNSFQANYNLQNSVVNENKLSTTNTMNGISFRYSNLAIPTSNYHILCVYYYDDYDTNLTFNPSLNLNSNIEGEPIYYNNTIKPKGLITESWIRVLENSNQYNAEKKYILYDNKSRPLSVFSNNYLNGYTQIDNKYDYAKTLYTITKHKRTNSDTEIYIKDDYTYTNQNRILSHIQQVGNAISLPSPQLIAKNTYDELGQLIVKDVGGTDITNFNGLQRINYEYNIRGWLTNINDINDLNNGTDPSDLFAYKINYNTVENETNYTGKKQYNGNISETYWKSKSDNVLRKYGYKYDNLNRLTNAIYQKPNTSIPVTNSYNESLGYDKNGNILFLKRNGELDDSSIFITIDNLSYYYKPNSNQVTKITDESISPEGFLDDSTDGTLNTDTTNDYDYSNGNLIYDENKGILNNGNQAIFYNHLNLPTKLIFPLKGTIQYKYNAIGKKIKKTIIDNTSFLPITTTTDYLDGFQYENSILKFFSHDEGYVSNTIVNGNFNFKYVFNYVDHLGNIRLSYTKNTATSPLKILEENHYYPFGLKHNNYNIDSNYFIANNPDPNCTICPINDPISIKPAVKLPFKFKFNSKEFQNEFYFNAYDYGSRLYDPAIGRWSVIDSKSELSIDVSPYSYAYNSPLFFIDIDGEIPTPYEAALMAANVYNHNTKLAGGWSESPRYASNRDLKNGLMSSMYERRKADGTIEYAYVFAGSVKMNDWMNNLEQVLGLSSQYQDAVDAAKEISKYCKMDYKAGSELTFIGHSLGGGLAMLASLVTGRSAIAFNPAWLSFGTKVRNIFELVKLEKGNSRRTFVHEGDPLTKLQDRIGIILGLTETGKRYVIESDFLDWDPIENHSMEESISEMEENGGYAKHVDSGSDDYEPVMRDDDDYDDVSQSPRYF
ncbi:DUF6443 domain-containing protein [Flavobacterium sp. SUN046]|uniref:DUF6443 domain-containing protein n=1 Tax=Flavobacterium sp. SUN046 TaxID=3002440 RepID=UPI002DBCD40D|nr:DUF6443 domain-containing protein [Flavobacterium sp. SUN046]MEC4050935.1 DUF6443 domain-containing protein [Flavobacterium sp. SUN046]